jgi:hypothetical protein
MGHGTMSGDRKRIAAAIRDYIARERMSREQFAFKTKLGKSTVDKLLTGIFSEKTLSIIGSHLWRGAGGDRTSAVAEAQMEWCVGRSMLPVAGSVRAAGPAGNSGVD